MPVPLNKLDDRAFADLVAETRALIPRYAPEWTDHNESDPGITLIELFAWLAEILIYRINRIPEASEARFLEMLGARFSAATPATVTLDLNASNLDAAGLVIPSGTPLIALVPGRIDTMPYETTHDVSLTPGVPFSAVEARQTAVITGENLGVSDGKPFQVFPLPLDQFLVFDEPTPGQAQPLGPGQTLPETDTVITQPTRIEVIIGGETWNYQPDFLDSTAANPHFTVDTRLNALRFGDGSRGRIPPAGQAVLVTFMATLGTAGNPPAGVSFSFDAASPLISAPLLDAMQAGTTIGIANLRVNRWGSNPVTLAQAHTQAINLLKTRWRAVTAQDFERLTLEQVDFNIIRAKCLPELDLTSDTPHETSPGHVSVIIVPDAASETPAPDQATINAVWSFLDQRRLITCRHHVVSPEYVPTRIQAAVVRNPQASESGVKDGVQANLRAFFHPITGGPDNTGWPFGRNVHASEVYQVIENTTGVDHVEGLHILTRAQDDTWTEAGEHLEVPPNKLVHFTAGTDDLRIWTER